MAQKNNWTWLNQDRLNSQEQTSDDCFARSPIYRDLGQLIHLGQFRRLSNKTQVYSNPDSTVRSRLTHSLEAKNVAIQISRIMIEELLRFSKEGGISESNQETHQKVVNICNMEDLISFSSLAHDLGHPPFAHAGERFLNSLSSEGESIYRFRKFDSNFQNLRLLTTLHPYGSHNSLAFTHAALDSILKEKPNSPYHKGSVLLEEEIKIIETVSEKNQTIIDQKNQYVDRWKTISSDNATHYKKYTHLSKGLSGEKILLRHPVSFLMEVADDISYMSSDIEDAIKLDYIDPYDFIDACETHKIFPIRYKDKRQYTTRDIKEAWTAIVNGCILHDNYEPIKTALIQTMIHKVRDLIVLFVKKYATKEYISENFDIKDPTLFDFINNLPILMTDFVFEKWDYNAEFGNFLYLKHEDWETYDFFELKDKFIKAKLIMIKRVREGDDEGKRVLRGICDSLIPKYKGNFNLFSLCAKKRLKFLSNEYQQSVEKTLANHNMNELDKVSRIQNIFVDYIASMTDPFAIQLNDHISDKFAA